MTEPTEAAPPRPANGLLCLVCRQPADGWRWFGTVKMRPGRWEPTCGDHRNRSGVPLTWRAADTDHTRA